MEKRNIYILVGIALAVLIIVIVVSLTAGKAGSRHLGWMTGVNSEVPAAGSDGAVNLSNPNTAPIDRAKAVKDLMERRRETFDEAVGQR